MGSYMTYSEFANMPEAEWPGSTPTWDSLRETEYKEEELVEIRISPDVGYYSTVEEIAEEFGLSTRQTKRILKQALGNFMAALQDYKGTKDCHLLAESMLYYKESTNFFNPNQGGNTWASLRSLLSM